MPQTINIPTVGPVNFPDGMSDADIASAIQRNYPQIHGNQADAQGGGAMDFVKQMAQSGGRMLLKGATAIPGVLADGTAAAANLGADALGAQRPFSVLPSQAMDNAVAPVLGRKPTGAGGIAEDIGSGLVGGKIPMPGVAPAASAAADVVPATRNQQLATLAKNDVRLDNSQALPNSRLALSAKNYANDGPFGTAQAFTDAQHGDFTRAVLSHMGIDGGAREALPSVMQDGKQALKDAYNGIAQRTNLTPDDPLWTDLDSIEKRAMSSLTPENATVIQGKIKDLMTMMENNKSQLSGTQYQKYQQDLGDIAADGGKAPFVTMLRQAVTGMLERQASPMDSLLLQRTNQQYGAMKAIEKSITPQNTVSPSLLYNALDTAKGANQMVYGKGPNAALADLAQAGKSILGTNTPNSGTTQRGMGALTFSGAGAALLALATGNFSTAAEFAGGAVAGGMSQTVAQKLAYTPGGKAALQAWAKSKLAAGNAVGAAMPDNTLGAIAGATQ